MEPVARLVTSVPEPTPHADPQALVDAVQADIDGRVTVEQLALIRQHPTAVLGILREMHRDVEVQLEARHLDIQRRISAKVFPKNWGKTLYNYRKWARAATNYKRRVAARIREMEARAPEAVLRELLREGLEIDAADETQIKAWQDRARPVLEGPR